MSHSKKSHIYSLVLQSPADMKMWRSTTLILVILGAVSAAKNYHGYKLYEIQPQTQSHQDFLKSLRKNPEFDFWMGVNNLKKPVELTVSPKLQENFEIALKTQGILFSTKIQDVGQVFEAQNEERARRKPLAPGKVEFDRYLRHREMNEYLAQLAEDFSSLVSLVPVGNSYENRSMQAIKISSGPREPPKPVIFIAAGIHAREWIAPSTAIYTINQLVENEENANLLESVDWLVLPVFNPDGYDFTFTEDRMWRKTVSKGESCDGTDCCRNFGFHWLESGADDFECSEVYAGTEEFSEIESRNVRDILENQDFNIQAYISLHSAAQLILYPYSYDYVLADNWEEHQDLGGKMNDAIKSVNGTEYEVVSGADLYPCSGTDDDYAKGVAGIPLVFVFELPGRGFGFAPPPDAILPVGEETFEGFKVLHQHVAENYRNFVISLKSVSKTI